MMNATSAVWLTLLSVVAQPASPDDGGTTASPPEIQTLIVVVGAAGETQYGVEFRQWGSQWLDTARAAQLKCIPIGLEQSGARDELNQVETALDQQPKISPEPLWIVLIGHGTYDGRQAKFNLRGPDLTAEQLAQWLSGFRRTVVIINCASASSPFMNALAGEHRIIITSTKSGYQYNFSRFGKYLAQTVGDPQADLDKDGQTSLLEAFLLASSPVAEFYRQEARLATEEALLDDNGDGRGTPASWFRGVRAVKKAKDDAPVDGMRAHQLHLVRSVQEQRLTADQRVRRNALEAQLAARRAAKPQLDEDEYYRQLLPIMLELADLYRQSAPTSPQ